MKANKAFKFRIYPNKEQANFINQNIGACRFIYNQMLEDKIKYYEENKKTLNNTPAQYKEEHLWLKDMDAYALCNEQMNLQTMFKQLLNYKLLERGKLFIKIDKWFPSSKTCHNCGAINKELKLSDRVWTCPACGAVIERDYNAALNIRDAGLALI